MLDLREAPDPRCLTPRERVIVALFGEGLHPRRIAEMLSVEHRTLSRSLRTIHRKIGVSDGLGLTLYARYRLRGSGLPA